MSERNTIYLCLAHMSDEGYEQKYVKEAFDTNWVVPMGPNVNEFEKDLETFVNTNPTNDTNLDRKVVCLESGSVLYESKDGPYHPLEEDEIMVK